MARLIDTSVVAWVDRRLLSLGLGGWDNRLFEEWLAMGRTTMGSPLTVDELGRSLEEVLERVRGGERFVVERGGEVVASIGPPTPTPTPGVTLRDIIDRVGDLKMPGDGFADDLEEVQAAQGVATVVAWPN